MPRTERLIPVAGAAVLAAAAATLAGWLVAENPALLHVTPSLRNLSALCAALAGASLLIVRPRTGIVVLVALVYLNLSELLVRFHGFPSIMQAIGVPLVIGAWVGQGTRSVSRTIAPTPLTVALLAFVFVLFVSSSFAHDAALADERIEEHAKAMLVYFLVIALVWSPSLARRATWTLLFAGALIGGIGLIQVLTGEFDSTVGGLGRVKFAQIYGNVFRPRIAGPVGDPNFYAQILIPVAAIGLVLAGHVSDWRRRTTALVCAGLATGGIVLSYSRGALLAVGLVAFLAALANRIPMRRLVPAALLGALLLFALQPAGLTRRMATIREFLPGQEEAIDPDSSFGERKLLMTVAWIMFADRPIIGVGAGNYTTHFDAYADETGSAFRQWEGVGARRYPHNLYLEIAAETGVIGLLLFGAGIVACFALLRRARLAHTERGDRFLVGVARGIEVALVGHLVTSLFLHGAYPRHLWLLFGLAAAVARVAQPSSDPLHREVEHHDDGATRMSHVLAPGRA
jgi:O-antigen ligase